MQPRAFSAAALSRLREAPWLTDRTSITFPLTCSSEASRSYVELPYAASSTRMWVYLRVTLVQQLGCMQNYHFFQLWAAWNIFPLAGIACRREEVLRDFIFRKRSVSLRLPSCFVWFVFLFRGCFVSALRRHLAFCISPVLQQWQWLVYYSMIDSREKWNKDVRSKGESNQHWLEIAGWDNSLLSTCNR